MTDGAGAIGEREGREGEVAARALKLWVARAMPCQVQVQVLSDRQRGDPQPTLFLGWLKLKNNRPWLGLP